MLAVGILFLMSLLIHSIHAVLVAMPHQELGLRTFQVGLHALHVTIQPLYFVLLTQR